MNPQKMIWTRTGVPRKNQMEIQLALLMSGFGDSRITARITPSTIPINIASTVNSSVISTPRSTGPENRYWPTTPHWKRGLLTTELTSPTSRTATIAALIQRPGCLTGTAFISSGGPASAMSAAASGGGTRGLSRDFSLADRSVDLRGCYRALREPPVIEDLLVCAVGDDRLHGAKHRLRHAVVLRHRDSVGL